MTDTTGDEPRLAKRVKFLLRLRPELAERLALVEGARGWSRNHALNAIVAEALPALEAACGIGRAP